MKAAELYEHTKKRPTKEAVELFLFGHLNYIYSCAKRICIYGELNDLVSETYLSLLKGWRSIDFTKSYQEIKAYLNRSVYNQYAVTFRKHRIITSQLESWHDFYYQPEPESDIGEIILGALTGFNRIVAQEILDGRTVNEIAKRHHLTKQAISIRLKRMGRDKRLSHLVITH